jgi:predicted acetyltransferase
VAHDVRIITEDEHKQWFDHLGRAFFQHHAEGLAEFYWPQYEPGRARAAFEGTEIVGTLRSFGTELTVPGPTGIRSSALTAVSVAPTHRRKGILRSMLLPDLADSKERGEPVGILTASEFPIYGRFGYGPATEYASYEIATTDLHMLRASEGSFEMVDLATMRKQGPPIFDRFRTVQPGSIERDDAWWDSATRQVEVPGKEPRKGFQAIYRSSAGDPEGYVWYAGKFDGTHIPVKGTLTIEEMVATTPEAQQAIWEFCFNVDLATTTVAPHRSLDELLYFLVDDARKIRQLTRTDFLWVRVLDAAPALEGRRYVADGRIVLEVIDDLGFTSGRFELVVADGSASCRATAASPDLTASVQGLGSAYLGGVSWAKLSDAGQVDEHERGSLALADRMFMSARAPWCTTHF